MPDLDARGSLRLARSVVRQAAEDVGDTRLSDDEREEARAFLRGGAYLQMRAPVLGLTIDSVRRRYRHSCGDALDAPAPLPARVPPRPPRRATPRPPAEPSILDVPPGGWFIEPDFD